MSINPVLKFETRDEFKRRAIADKVISLLDADIDVSPMVIDGGWGLGKTEFCQKLINLMAEKGTHELIYIDAFKADHANEPLLTVLAEVLKVLPSETKNSLAKMAIPALRYSLKTGAKAVVSHLLRQDAADVIEEFEAEIKQVAEKAIDASVESLLKDHVEAEKSLLALQDGLKTIAALKPLVIFIDELDRCRPDFAVLLLETIKHTFDVDGVQFVLVTNTDQLKASINHCYGPTIDAQRYLDKFLKFSFTLPSTVNEYRNETRLASVHHYQYLVRESSTLKNSGIETDAYLNLMERIIEVNSISLREIETFVRQLEIYQTISNDDPLGNKPLGYKLLRMLGISLYTFKPELAKAAQKNKLDAMELGKFLGVENLPSFEDVYGYPDYPDIILFALATECQFNSHHFIPGDTEQISKWNKAADQVFHELWREKKDEKFKISLKAVSSLCLAG